MFDMATSLEGWALRDDLDQEDEGVDEHLELGVATLHVELVRLAVDR
jgi:hypothetical protein